MRDSCNRFVSLDDVLQLVPDIAGLIAAKPCSGDMDELSWFFWIVVFLSVWVIYTTSA